MPRRQASATQTDRLGQRPAARPVVGSGRWRAGTRRSVQEWRDWRGMISGGHDVSPSWSGPGALPNQLQRVVYRQVKDPPT